MVGLRHAHYFQRAWYLAQFSWVKLVVGRYERRAYQESRLVMINYDSVRKLVLAKYGSAVKFRKLPYTSEMAFLCEQTEAPPAAPDSVANLQRSDAPLIVAISRHDARKGINVFLHALAELRVAGVPFHACLVGGGPLIELHRRLALQLGLDDVTTIEGWVPDPQSYLRQADVFVLPSLQEGSGSISLIEALQAGVAVVASNVDGIPEDVANGDSALLVKPGDVSQLCEALRRVLGDTAPRQHLARRGREIFAEKFCPEVFSTALRQTYVELLAESAVSADLQR
jgi:glycosyltransferase involved in cell wall biosynthesis